MSDFPLVSVVMPVYNAGHYLPAAIDSILNQTFTDFEFICIDDGSTDSSANILNDYARRDARVKVVTQPNAGITPTLNKGLSVARGEFIARMDSDDLALPQRFAAQVEFLKNHPDHVLVGSQVLLIDPEGRPLRTKPDTSFEHDQIERALLNKGWPLVHPAVMMRADAVRSLGGYDNQYVAVQDHDLFVRLSEVGRLANLPETLLQYRQHFNAISFAKSQVQADALTLIVQRARERRGMEMPAELADTTPRDRSPTACRTDWVWSAIKGGNLQTARVHALAVLRESPRQFGSWKLIAHALVGR